MGRLIADDATMRTPVRRALSAAAAVTALLLGAAVPSSAVDQPALETYATPGDGVFRVVGSGWGHGRGMSQWGAYQAATEGATFDQILSFYYPGTLLLPLPTAPVRVLIAGDTGRDLVVRATPGLTAQQVGADPVVLPSAPAGCGQDASRWRVRADGAGMRLDAYCGRWVPVDRVAGASLSFGSPDGIVATQNGVVRRGYRGLVAANRIGARSVQVVNTVPMEDYLRSVVAAEVSPSWPDAALQAQAVAARSYAARESQGRAGKAFDVYDSTRSQAYPGAVWYDSAWRVVRAREHVRTDQAIASTAGLHVTVDGVPVLTQFSSSNGGASAASPLPHMIVAADAWDARATRNPRLSWTRTVSAADLAKRYKLGTVTAVEVLGREGQGPWGGRVTALRVVGSSGSRVLTGDSAIRAGLGVSSSMLTISPPA
jgi:SpoIID/LytB domain protein